MSRKTHDQGQSKKPRCAVYTRKSTEEGLEQNFNSLDAQREACEAYIQSQKHEGWQALSDHYDDGGFSGGDLERPAFKRLIEDIESGKVDTVVVYKVDRLTRALNDFAKIVDVFDRNDVSFVSVTQQFNTTTSMGRLTLNMLLSFAQFEREITGERIRDKIAASKRKGLWMGGVPPLGYDVKEKKLIVNLEESKVVLEIFTRYLRHESVHALKTSLDQDGFSSKIRIDKHGKRTGGKPFARGALYKLLQNRIYRGEIVHKEASYPGEQEAIVSQELWDQVQQKLHDSRVERSHGIHAAEPSLLVGLVYDETGQRMTPTHANKKGTRYRYYISQTLTTQTRNDVPRGWRVPARDLERIVIHRLKEFLDSETDVYEVFESQIPDVNERMRRVKAAKTVATEWDSLKPATQRARLLDLIYRIGLERESLSIWINRHRLSAWLEHTEAHLPDRRSQSSQHRPLNEIDADSILALTVAVKLKRAGMETRLLIDGIDPHARTKPDRSLYRLLATAEQYRTRLMERHGKSMNELAAEAGVCSSRFTRVLRLSFLAPDIVQVMLQDRHPVELNAEHLSKRTDLPFEWDEQRQHLGID